MRGELNHIGIPAQGRLWAERLEQMIRQDMANFKAAVEAQDLAEQTRVQDFLKSVGLTMAEDAETHRWRLTRSATQSSESSDSVNLLFYLSREDFTEAYISEFDPETLAYLQQLSRYEADPQAFRQFVAETPALQALVPQFEEKTPFQVIAEMQTNNPKPPLEWDAMDIEAFDNARLAYEEFEAMLLNRDPALKHLLHYIGSPETGDEIVAASRFAFAHSTVQQRMLERLTQLKIDFNIRDIEKHKERILQWREDQEVFHAVEYILTEHERYRFVLSENLRVQVENRELTEALHEQEVLMHVESLEKEEHHIEKMLKDQMRRTMEAEQSALKLVAKAACVPIVAQAGHNVSLAVELMRNSPAGCQLTKEEIDDFTRVAKERAEEAVKEAALGIIQTQERLKDPAVREAERQKIQKILAVPAEVEPGQPVDFETISDSPVTDAVKVVDKAQRKRRDDATAREQARKDMQARMGSMLTGAMVSQKATNMAGIQAHASVLEEHQLQGNALFVLNQLRAAEKDYQSDPMSHILWDLWTEMVKTAFEKNPPLRDKLLNVRTPQPGDDKSCFCTAQDLEECAETCLNDFIERIQQDTPRLVALHIRKQQEQKASPPAGAVPLWPSDVEVEFAELEGLAVSLSGKSMEEGLAALQSVADKDIHAFLQEAKRIPLCRVLLDKMDGLKRDFEKLEVQAKFGGASPEEQREKLVAGQVKMDFHALVDMLNKTAEDFRRQHHLTAEDTVQADEILQKVPAERSDSLVGDSPSNAPSAISNEYLDLDSLSSEPSGSTTDDANDSMQSEAALALASQAPTGEPKQKFASFADMIHKMHQMAERHRNAKAKSQEMADKREATDDALVHAEDEAVSVDNCRQNRETLFRLISDLPAALSTRNVGVQLEELKAHIKAEDATVMSAVLDANTQLKQELENALRFNDSTCELASFIEAYHEQMARFGNNPHARLCVRLNFIDILRRRMNQLMDGAFASMDKGFAKLEAEGKEATIENYDNARTEVEKKSESHQSFVSTAIFGFMVKELARAEKEHGVVDRVDIDEVQSAVQRHIGERVTGIMTEVYSMQQSTRIAHATDSLSIKAPAEALEQLTPLQSQLRELITSLKLQMPDNLMADWQSDVEKLVAQYQEGKLTLSEFSDRVEEQLSTRLAEIKPSDQSPEGAATQLVPICRLLAHTDVLRQSIEGASSLTQDGVLPDDKNVQYSYVHRHALFVEAMNTVAFQTQHLNAVLSPNHVSPSQEVGAASAPQRQNGTAASQLADYLTRYREAIQIFGDAVKPVADQDPSHQKALAATCKSFGHNESGFPTTTPRLVMGGDVK